MITEPRLIAVDSVTEAWRNATSLLIDEGDRFNLTLHVRNPTALDETTVARFCPTRVDSGIAKTIYDVANTIFPSEGRHHSGPLDNFFAHYLQVYVRGQRRFPSSWGCYFLRLAAFGTPSENQLRKIIDALSGWRSKPRAAFVLHLSSTALDNPRPLGAPCWQYGQFIRNGDSTLSLVAVYRSHDYFEKALGNFVGLSRLLRFVCHHSKMNPGTLTCLSTYATLQGKRAKARELIDR
jgi:hypothetical protein